MGDAVIDISGQPTIYCQQGLRGDESPRALFAHDAKRKYREVNKMKNLGLPKNLGMVLLGIWLIMTGLIPLLHLNFEGLPLIMSILAIASGAILLLGR